MPMVQHYVDHNHNMDNLKFTILEIIKTDKLNNDKILLQRECFWIHYLNPLTPNGLNLNNDLSCFLG